MTPPRFYIPPEYIQTPVVTFPPDRCSQINNVLRLKTGDLVHVFDISGAEYQVRLTVVQRNDVQGEIITVLHPQTEPALALELWVCASRREKIEWIIQKCTEIGVSSFRFLVSERSLVQKVEDIQQKKDRWQQIAMEAAEQSGRIHVPEILPPFHIQQALSLSTRADTLKCIAWELDRQHTIDQLLQQIILPQKVILVIGPEGGLSDAEVQFALDNDFHAITLGNRIFRLETAAMVGCVLILNAFHTL
jgi:16S rRNA (uracil1498-N3)-methyltransferase